MTLDLQGIVRGVRTIMLEYAVMLPHHGLVKCLQYLLLSLLLFEKNLSYHIAYFIVDLDVLHIHDLIFIQIMYIYCKQHLYRWENIKGLIEHHQVLQPLHVEPDLSLE